MQKISKKVLALILCLAMILSVPFSAAAAGDGTSPREALLSAWKNLVYEKYTPLAEAKAEGTAPGIELISSLPNELGLTTQQKSVFGSKIVKFTGTGAVWTEVDKDVALKIYDGEVSFDTTKVGVYTTFDQIELHALLGNNYPLPSGWNLVNKGCTVMELKDLNGLIEGLINGTIDAGGNSLSVICDYVSGGNGNIYVGAVMGVNYTKETVPAEVSSMSDKELYDYAVANVMLDKYVDGVEEFEAALNELYKAIFIEENPEKAPIIIAWGNLLKEEAVTLAWGKETTSIPAELNLTDAQKALLGDRLTVINRDVNDFVQRTADTALNESLTANIASLNIKKVQFSLYTDIAEVELHPYSDGNFLNGWNLTGNGFKTIDVTSDMAAFLNGTKAFSSYSYISDYSNVTGNVYIGALLGYRDVKETVPMDAYNWSLEQLYVEAAKLDTTKYVGGVDEFNAALNALYAKFNPETAELINAWGNLEKDEYVTIAYSGGVAGGSPTIGDSESLTMLTDEQRAMMGSHYWQMNSSSDKVYGITWENTDNFSQYDSVFYVIYGNAGAVCTQINGGAETYTGANGFTKVAVTPTTSWWSLQHWSYDWYAPIYIGSVVGHKTVKATVPAEVYSMTEKELYDYVVANVNTSDYSIGVEEFNAALDALYAKVHPEAAAVINAWGNLEKDEYVTIAYPGGVAGGNPTVGESSSLTGLTDEQKAKMGSHYWAMNANGDKVYGITWENADIIGKCDSYFFAIYAPNGYSGAIETQYNGTGTVYTGANPFVIVSVSPSTSWWSIQHYCYEWYSTFYVGSVVGHKTVKATVPAEVYSMTEKELYDYVVANVNAADYSAGVEEFNAALAELKELTKGIANGDFEKGSVNGWNGDIAIDNAVANGAYSAKIDGVATYNANLEANEIYMLTFKAYREDVANNFGISIVSGESEVLYTTTSEFTSDVIGEFVEFKAVIKSNADTAEFTITSNGAVWVDDFNVAEYVATGDSNLDGEVDIIDLVRLQKYTLELISNNKPAADANNDGLVNATDMVVLKKGIMASF